MSDNEDLLGDDLGDQSLADYNLGNDEEDQLLADDYESGGPQNVPTSIGEGYSEPVQMVQPEYANHAVEYAPPPMQYQPVADTESVVPNISVEVPNIPPHSTYAPIEPRHYEAEHAVPPAIPAGAREPPQIVPSELSAEPNGEVRERFVTERPVGAQRMPQVRDIPDSLDKVVIPRGLCGGMRGRSTWRAAHFQPRYHAHPYRTNNTRRGNFNQRNSFPPPQQIIRPNIPPQIIRQEIRPDMIRPDIRPDVPEMIRPEMIRPDMPPEMRPEMRELPNLQPPPQMGPEISPEHPILPDMSFRLPMERFERPPFQPFPRFQFREERPMFNPMRPNFDRPMYPYRQFAPRFPPTREIIANSAHIPQVTIRQVPDKMPVKEPEVRMLPVPLPPHIPPGGLAGKKVLINPHFKGNFQPPVEGLPAYIPTRIQKSPPLSPTKFGPIKDIDDAAERFIAEQRSALARAAGRKFPRRSPQRYIENTTIEIENDLALRPPAAPRPPAPRRRSNDDDDLLRRQEEFINANREGLRRRMRSPSPPGTRRSPSPRRARPDPHPARPHHDSEESDYKRRLREQESLRERVLRAKEVRRRKNAVALHKQMQDRERETQEKNQPPQTNKENQPATIKEKEPLDNPEPSDKPTSTEETKPDTTRRTPERKSPDRERKEWKEEVKAKEKVKEVIKAKDDEVNSTCEALTPPPASPARTPPWPAAGAGAEDDDLELILGDIDGILSDDEDSGRFKDKPAPEPEPPKPKPVTDLRSKLPPKTSADKPQRQKIVFTEDKEERKRKEKTPPRRALVSSSKADDADDRKSVKTKTKAELSSIKSRQRITFDYRQKELEKEKETKQEKTPPFNNRRVILQRKITKEKSIFSRMDAERSQPSAGAGIFSRAVRTALRDTQLNKDEPHVQYESESDVDEDKLLNEDLGTTAAVDNLPHGMTDTRLRTLAGADVQNLILEKEERSAKITFKTSAAAENFKKKFNNKMVAASRLTVSLR